MDWSEKVEIRECMPVLLVNGTGIPASTYKPIFDRLLKPSVAMCALPEGQVPTQTLAMLLLSTAICRNSTSK